MRPKRIQRKRTKGWRMPKNAVYVGRGSKWGNPFVVGIHGTAEECVRRYVNLARRKTSQIFAELHGKNLCCWCPLDQPCHADWLLEVANG